MTGYLDNELGLEERTGVEQHLAGCVDCRELLEAVRKTAVIPFKETVEMQPDRVVWERIAGKLRSEKVRPGSVFWDWLDRIASWRPLPVLRVAFVMALILVVIAVAQWPFQYTDPAYAYMEEQMTFLGELEAGNNDLLNGDFNEYDIVFEEITD
jgi:anti-sigma factor RsiW